MTSKKVLNSEELEKLLTPQQKESAYEGTRLSKKFKNSLDSDEEDDEEKAKKYNVLNPEDFDGHEEATIDRDGEIQITPFNMKEELEEGYFDKDGTYIFQRNEDDVKDQWLDDIDWVKVKTTEGSKVQKRSFSDSDSDDLPELNVIGHYQKMVEFMQPGETVQKAICRLGGKQKKSKRQKKQVEPPEEEDSEKKLQDKERLQELTSLASELLTNGNTDIYQQTFEGLSFSIKQSEKSKSSIYGSEDAADMFGDSFDEKQSTSDNKSASNGSKESNSELPDVMWEFKWEAKEDSTVYGPHTTQEMYNWVQEGYFADGVFVRRIGERDSQFYNSKRMDFELYL